MAAGPLNDVRAPLRSASPDHTVHYIKIYNFNHACCQIAFDPALDLIYIGAGARIRGNNTVLVDGSSLTIVKRVRRFGGAGNVDPKTHNVWLPGLYAGDVAVFSGARLRTITKVPLGDCPIASWVDAHRRYAWIAAQCGNNFDPVWAVNADSYGVIAKIGTPGVMGPNIVNPVTGTFYVNKNGGGNYEIDPHTFKATPTSFGVVNGVNAAKDLLYAYITHGLNIIDGRSGKVLKTLDDLPYTEGVMAVNDSLDHLYLSAARNYIEVRDGDTGRLLKTISLAPSYMVLSLGADAKRRRIYAAVDEGGSIFLRWWRDDTKRS